MSWEGSPTPSDGGFQPSVWTDHPLPWRSSRPHVLSTVGEAQQEELKGAVQELPATADIGLAQLERDDSPSVGGGPVWHRPLLEQMSELAPACTRAGSAPVGIRPQTPQAASAQDRRGQREAFVAEYAALTEEAQHAGAKIFLADEAHFLQTRNCVASGY
jgi:hypothetical protein